MISYRNPYLTLSYMCTNQLLVFTSTGNVYQLLLWKYYFRESTISIFSYFFQIMSEYDQTFDPNILIGHCDLISRFSDFALYLGTQVVYEQTSFTLCLRMTRPLTLKYSWVNMTLFHGSVIFLYISALNWYMNILLSRYVCV